MFPFPPSIPGRIVVDPERLAVLASSLKLAHDALKQSPRYARLDAGDVERRLPQAVADFIADNEGPRDEMVAQLDMAHQMVGAAARFFGETENVLVQALTKEDA